MSCFGSVRVFPVGGRGPGKGLLCLLIWKNPLGDHIPASAGAEASSGLEVAGEGLQALVRGTISESRAGGLLASEGADSFERALSLWMCRWSSLALSGVDSL